MHIVYSFFYDYMYSSEVPVKSNGIIYRWTGISAGIIAISMWFVQSQNATPS